MFNSIIIDTAIGIIFIYLLLSLMCSAVAEGIESFMRNRATDLERGIRELITEQKSLGGLESLVKRIWPRLARPTGSPPAHTLAVTSPPEGVDYVALLYNHPLISGLFKGTYNDTVQFRMQALFQRFWQWLMTGSPKLPTYIPSRNFALAVLDIAAPQDPALGSPPSASIDQLRNALVGEGRIPADSKLGKALLTLIDAAGNDVNKARQNIENWYDSAMDRVSGWYKRRTQFIIFAIGLLVAIAVNADTVVIVKKLATDKALRDSVAAAAVEYAKANATASPSPSPSPLPSPSPSPSPSSSTSPTPLPGCGPGKEETPQCKYSKAESQLTSFGLPIGWDTPGEHREGESVDDQNLRKWPGLHFWDAKFWTNWKDQLRYHILGWLLTALAVSMGAPFWFDLLNKFIVIRSTVKPKEKSPEEKSKD
jgi:hypothetical protein